jgi:hypothetical protein
MIDLKRIKEIDIKDITIKRLANAILRRIKSIPHNLSWFLPFSFTIKNKNKLKSFHNIHKDERCFIICNGPSLKSIDFSFLKNEKTIGMNRIYLMKDQNEFSPNYLACIDKKSQLLQFTKDYDNLEIPCFFNWDVRNLFTKKPNQIFIKSKFESNFSTDIVREPMGNGKSVTYACIHLAYYMGFKEVYLIGKDHSYNTIKKAGVGISSTGNEDNHFIKGYYTKGQNWDAPDYRSEENAYKLSREAFNNDGRVIKDATINGKLNVFEKVDFFKLIKEK